MNHEWHEAIISFKGRFHALKTDMDIVHQAWQTAIREGDLDRQSRLIAHEQGLVLEVAAVKGALQQLISQASMRTQAWRRLKSPLA